MDFALSFNVILIEFDLELRKLSCCTGFVFRDASRGKGLTSASYMRTKFAVLTTLAPLDQNLQTKQL